MRKILKRAVLPLAVLVSVGGAVVGYASDPTGPVTICHCGDNLLWKKMENRPRAACNGHKQHTGTGLKLADRFTGGGTCGGLQVGTCINRTSCNQSGY